MLFALVVHARKWLLGMRLTALLLLSACLMASATGLAQTTLTLSEKNAPLEKIFKVIKKQTGYDFIYENKLLQEARKVNIEVKGASLEQVLDICFRDQPLTWSITGKIIVLKEKEKPAAVIPVAGPKASIDIHGIVTDEDGKPLPGATVKVKGTTQVTITDKDGGFFLQSVNEEAMLEVSFIGYQTVAVPVKGKTTITISLKRSAGKLDEVQVIAYGQTTKRLQTGNVTSIKAEDIEKQPVSNPLLALEGRVPGMFITQSTGFAGSGVTTRIQGINSIAQGNNALVVIDGVPYDSQPLYMYSTTMGGSGGFGSRGSGNSYGSTLSSINPQDIESIEILKDADATAIYGSRAANGAILITTKKGKAGEQRVDLNLQQGWGQVAERLPLLNLRQYLDMRYEALKNDGIDLATASPTDPNFYDLKVWDTTRTTDWQKVLLGNTAQYTDLQGSVSGGTANTSYLISTNYHRETTVLPGNFDDQKGDVHFQINSSSPNQRFHISLSGNYMVDLNQLPENADGSDLTELAMTLPPDAPPLYNKDGSINWAPDPNGNSTWHNQQNPAALLLNRDINNTTNLVSNALLSYNILPGLQVKSSFGFTGLRSDETGIIPLSSTAPELRKNATRVGTYVNNELNSWNIEPQITYTANISKGKLDALIGSTFEKRSTDEQALQGTGYPSDNVISNIAAATFILPIPIANYTYKYAALFGRLTYNWQDKYILDLTTRRDGSSRFGANNQFHDFWSVGSAWIFSGEDFVKKTLPFLSFGKLKASYGTTGNDQIGDFQFLSTYRLINAGVPYQGINTLQPNGNANPYLEWEETNKLNLGLDLGFFKDRILISADYFRNRSSNELLNYTLPITTGFGGFTANLPATVQNSGWELTMNTTNLDGKTLRWSTSFNLTIPRNKLVSFPGIENTTYANWLVVGQPISIVERYHLIGVDPATGLYYLKSATNPFNPQAPQDATQLIDTQPTFFGGLQNSISYGRFQLDFLFQFVKQIGPNYFFGRFPGYPSINQPVYVLDRWQGPGDMAAIEKFSTNVLPTAGDAGYSDGAYSDASYIRLKNASLSWRFPEGLLKKIQVKDLRVFVQGQNLLTFTNYKGLDPETMSSYSLPPLRVVTMGVHAGF